MKKLLIIDQAQFGYIIDLYYYCKFLKSNFDISFICWDYGIEKLESYNVKMHYISRKGNIVKRNIRFIIAVIRAISNNYYNIHLIEYFRGCSILKMFLTKKKFVLDIRTGSVNHNNIKRFIYNRIIKLESLFFENVSIISDSLRKKIDIPKEKSFILPQGSAIISKKIKNFNNIDLIYVGTLDNRNIEQTIFGLKLFINEIKSLDKKISYQIIGTGHEKEIKILKKVIAELQMEAVVKLVGYVRYTELKRYFDNANIGVSYIPMTKYYDCQPATKTFDYLLSGMPVIASSTKESIPSSPPIIAKIALFAPSNCSCIFLIESRISPREVHGQST